MDIIAPYHDLNLLRQGLVHNYGFLQEQLPGGERLSLPNDIGEGTLHLFFNRGLQFMRGAWNIRESATFYSPDLVKHSCKIDFRISKSREVRSAYLEKVDKYEWD